MDQTSFSPAMFFSSSWGIQMKYIVPLPCSGSVLQSHPSWTCLVQWEVPFTLRSLCMSELDTPSLRLSPRIGNSFWPLVFPVSFFWSLPKAHDHKWRLEHKLNGKLRALVCYNARCTANAALICLSISSSIFPLLVNNTPSPGAKTPKTILQQRTMASHLEMLTLTQLLHTQSPQYMLKVRVWSSANNREVILRSPNRTLSTPRLCF